jgi:hypothetical protein
MISWSLLVETCEYQRFSRLTSLKVRFHDRIHQSLLHLGIGPKDPGLERELPELRFPENRLTLPGLEGSVPVAVSMRLPCIGALVLGGSCLRECFRKHRLVKEAGDEVLHAAPLIRKIICDKR